MAMAAAPITAAGSPLMLADRRLGPSLAQSWCSPPPRAAMTIKPSAAFLKGRGSAHRGALRGSGLSGRVVAAWRVLLNHVPPHPNLIPHERRTMILNTRFFIASLRRSACDARCNHARNAVAVTLPSTFKNDPGGRLLL